MSLESLKAETTEQFKARFGSSPKFIAAAPGRVNLIGEHIDYNDGYVLPMAIERFTLVAVAPNDSDTIHIAAPDMNETADINMGTSLEPRPGHWTGYILGVAAGFQTRIAPVNGFNALIRSNVALGGGLSSSAALSVSFATAMEGLTGLTLKPLEKALLCKAAENNFAGVPCGIMDPLTSVAGKRGHALLIDCVTLDVNEIPFGNNEIAILITNSGIKHDLAEDAYAQRQQECKSALKKLGVPSWRDVSLESIDIATDLTDVELRRARHIVREMQRTRQASGALTDSDWKTLGTLMQESHESLRDDFEVSCTELDLLVDLQYGVPSVHGARMTGGGFGGCTVALVDSEAATAVLGQVQADYESKTGIQATSFITRPADGARLL